MAGLGLSSLAIPLEIIYIPGKFQVWEQKATVSHPTADMVRVRVSNRRVRFKINFNYIDRGVYTYNSLRARIKV